MNYIELYIGDYLKKTMHLSMAEHGAYLLLIATYYSKEGPLPDNPLELYKICRAQTGGEKRLVNKIADEFFPVAADGLRHNSRCDEMIAEKQKKVTAARANGRMGGRPITHRVNLGLDFDNPEESETKALHSPDPIPQAPRRNNKHRKLSNPELAEYDPSTTDGSALISARLQGESGFLEAWSLWCEYRKITLKKALSVHTAKLQLATLDTAKYPVYEINRAIERGWQSIFPSETTNGLPAANGAPVDTQQRRMPRL